MPLKKIKTYLLLCDGCCDNSGTLKEQSKTGGCTCDICGWSCKCVGDSCREFINRIPIAIISDAGWEYLQQKNAVSNTPLDWELLFQIGRE